MCKKTEEAREILLTLPGVGPKVADCILLFSELKRLEVFPVDVWVRRVMNDLYIKMEDENKVNKKEVLNLAKENNATTYIQKTFKTDDGTIPSTFVMKNGKVKVQKSGSLSYYRIAELFK